MSSQRHVLLWIIILALGFFLIPLVISERAAQERVGREVESVRSFFGDVAADEVVLRANHGFETTLVETGILDAVKRLISEKQEDGLDAPLGHSIDRMSDRTNLYVQASIANTYGLFFRIHMIFIWIPLIIPFIGAVVCDGVVSRKIKMSNTGYFSPAGYNMAVHILIAMVFLPIAYLLIPFAISPFSIPILALISAPALRIAIMNAQRIFG